MNSEQVSLESCLLSSKLYIHRLVCSLAPSGCSSYSEVSSQRGLLHNGPSQDCRAMYNPMTQPPGMTPGPGPGSQGHGSCMNQYMRPPMGPPPPPHSMMNHRGMMPNEGECSSPTADLIGCCQRAMFLHKYGSHHWCSLSVIADRLFEHLHLLGKLLSCA